MEKFDEKKLQALLLKNDERVKLGDEFRREDMKLVLVINSETEEFEESGKAACVNCLQLLSKAHGSHIIRHFTTTCKKRKIKQTAVETDLENAPPEKNRKISEFNYKKFKDAEVTKITESLAMYCLRSGRSFNHVSSSAFRFLVKDVANSISSGYGETAMSQLPSRQTIQKRAEVHSKKIVQAAFEKVKPFVGSRMSLLVDHGKIVDNYLSMFGSYIDENFQLQIVPLGFTASPDGKSGKETTNLILQRFQEYGYPAEKVLECAITADGALSTLGTTFSSYIRCVNHSLNLVSQHLFVPLEAFSTELSQYEEDYQVLLHILKQAQYVSCGIRKNNMICSKLSRLPSLPIETRWMSNVKCLKDILELRSEIEPIVSSLSIKARNAFLSITGEYKDACISILTVTKPLLQFNGLYQDQTSVTLHLVLPTYKLLEEQWTSLLDGSHKDVDFETINLQILSALCSSGLKHLSHYYEEFTDIHFAAVFLYPPTKKMTNFSPEEYEKAKKYVSDLLPTVTKPLTQSKSNGNSKIATFLSLVRDKSESSSKSKPEIETYIGEFVDENDTESVEEYWKKKQFVFPNLYTVATKVFSVVPSEAICESSFSQALFLLDKRRTRLQHQSSELVVLGTQLANKYPELLN